MNWGSGREQSQDIPEGDKKEEEELHNVKESTDGGLFSKRKKSDGLQMIGGGWVGEERTDITVNPQQVMENRKVSKPDFS